MSCSLITPQTSPVAFDLTPYTPKRAARLTCGDLSMFGTSFSEKPMLQRIFTALLCAASE